MTVAFRLRHVSLGLGLLCLSLTFCAWADITSVNDIIELDTKPTQSYELSAPIVTLDPKNDLKLSQDSTLSAEDTRNLDMLWQSVIQKNPVIQFGLKQLATPPELRYAHASIMSRTVSGLLSGAAMVPYMMGAGQLTAGATTVGSQLVDRAMTQSQKIDPRYLPSDTELVELSGMVQTLQKSLVENYFLYKNALISYVHLQQEIDLLGRQRQQQQDGNWSGDIMLFELSQSASEKQLLAKQASKRHYLVLERLVGVDVMRKLQFTESMRTVREALPSETISIQSAPQELMP